MVKRNHGLMSLFIGITRSGKSTPIKAMIPRAKRLLIWDAKNGYGQAFNLKVIRSIPQLLSELRKLPVMTVLHLCPQVTANQNLIIFADLRIYGTGKKRRL